MWNLRSARERGVGSWPPISRFLSSLSRRLHWDSVRGLSFALAVIRRLLGGSALICDCSCCEQTIETLVTHHCEFLLYRRARGRRASRTSGARNARDCTLRAPAVIPLFECVSLFARSPFARLSWGRPCSSPLDSSRLLSSTQLPSASPGRVAARSSGSRHFGRCGHAKCSLTNYKNY